MQPVEQRMEFMSLGYHDRIQIVGEGKSQMIGHRPFSAKMTLFRLRNLEKNLQFEDRSRRIKMPVYSQTPGGPLAHKKNL